MLIVKAAIMYANGEVLEGRDYGHINTLAHKLSYSGDRIEGFVTSTGDFVLPVEAATIAVRAGQLSDPVSKLMPEHLWPEGVTT